MLGNYDETVAHYRRALEISQPFVLRAVRDVLAERAGTYSKALRLRFLLFGVVAPPMTIVIVSSSVI
jgi:hypothetical protein